jgi:TctA family transporter
MIEKSLRPTLLMARGDWGMIVARPLTVGLLAVGLLVALGPHLYRGAAVLRRGRVAG